MTWGVKITCFSARFLSSFLLGTSLSFSKTFKKKSKSHLNEITASYVFLISPGRYRARNKHLRQEIQNCTKLRLLYRQT